MFYKTKDRSFHTINNLKERIKMLKLRKNQSVFYLAYFFFIIGLFIENVNTDSSALLRKVFIFLAVIVLVINYASHIKLTLHFELTMKSFVLTIVFLIVLFYVIKTSNYFLMTVVLFSINIEYFDMDEFFRVSMYSLIGLSLLVILCCSLDIFPNIQHQRNTAYNLGSIRHSLGFKGGLFLPNILVYVSAYYFTLRKKITPANFMFLQGVGVLLFIICDSRNGLIALEMLFVLQFLGRNKKESFRKRVISTTACISFPTAAFMSMILLQAYRRHVAFTIPINVFLSGRLQWALENMWKTPFKMVNLASHETFTATLKYAYDNGYFYLIARYGYLAMVLFCIVTIYAYKYMKKEENYPAMISFIVVALLNFIDNGLISYGFLPYFLMGIHSLYNIAKENKRRLDYG